MGVPTTYAYNKNKLIESVTNVKGDTIHLAYDKNLNLSCATFPDGTSSKWEYDSCGNCLSAMNPLGAVQTYQYDALNRVVRSKLPDGNEIELEYNGYKDVIRAKDKHTEACFDYTLLGSLKSQKQGKKVVKFEYDTEERLKAVINEKGEAYQFERDVKGNITKETGFDKVTRTYERDQAGRVKRINRPGGRFTEYRYDKAGRVTQINYSDKTWDKFAYNKNGQILEATNDQGTVKFEYNAAGRIIKEWRGDHWVASEYDELGNRIQITSSLGAKILTSRDSMGRMTHVAAAEAGQSAWMGKMQYNELGQEIERSLQGDVVSKWQYDATGRPMHHHVRVEDRDMRRRRYEWGINNQLNSMTNELSKGQTAYSYDEFSNLVSSRDDCWQYLYRSADEAGNIYETDDMSDRIYGAGSRLEMSGVNTKELQNVFQGGKGKLVTRGTEYAYDVEGNLVRKTEPNGGVWQYEYFGNGMLSKVVRPDETGISFKYDSLGRRIEKATSDATKQFFWDGNKLLHESESDVIITWVFDDGFVPTAKLTNAGNYSIVSDYLGTPAEAYDENGEKVWSAELDIYGKVKDFTGDVNFIPFRYQGQYADTETGLYYNRFRYYDPVIGQYTQQDPIRLVGNNPTLYGYVFNLTVFVDPFGLDIFDVLGGTPGQPDVLSRGGCEIIAQQVQAEIGGKFLNITPNTNLIPGASYLGDVTYSQGTISGWTAHVAVVQDGIVYDAMTGPTGMPIQDYQNMFQESDVLNFETSDKITIGCGG
jgi:RHS repeat-associated protein